MVKCFSSGSRYTYTQNRHDVLLKKLNKKPLEMQVCFLSQIRRAVLDRRRTTLPSMSSCSEIIKPLQTISKTYSYKSKQNKNKPKNRITNTFTHKSRTCLTFLWNQKAKYQYTEGKEDTLRKKDKNTVCCCFKNQQTSFDPLF